MYGDRGYSFEIDWWAVGVIFWELTENKDSPFGRTKYAIRQNLVEWSCSHPHVGAFIESERWTRTSNVGLDFQLAMLNPRPLERLGSAIGGNVLEHPLFGGGALERVQGGEQAVPYKPSAAWC